MEGTKGIKNSAQWLIIISRAFVIITSISNDSDGVTGANVWSCSEIELLTPSICVTKHVVVELPWCKAACVCVHVWMYTYTCVVVCIVPSMGVGR